MRPPAIYVEVKGVFSNTVPVDAYRGAGRHEACYVVERLVDTAAREMGIDLSPVPLGGDVGLNGDAGLVLGLICCAPSRALGG
jgi:hypothetical protein